MSLNVLEIRDYLHKPHILEDFIDYFEVQVIAELHALDVHVLGQFRVIGAPDHFVWLRAFADMTTRKQGLEGFYGGKYWKRHRRAINSMLVDSDNVHLLRPLVDIDLLAGYSAARLTADWEAGLMVADSGVVVIDYLHARAGDRDALLAAFQAQALPAYAAHAVQVRGVYGAEMSENTYPRLPAIQDADELVVITAYKDETVARQRQKAVATQLDAALGPLLAQPTDTLLLRPTLRSPLRYRPDGD